MYFDIFFPLNVTNSKACDKTGKHKILIKRMGCHNQGGNLYRQGYF